MATGRVAIPVLPTFKELGRLTALIEYSRTGSIRAINGVYVLTAAEPDHYTLSPTKSDDVREVSAYDASLVLQHAAGPTNLSGYAAMAADVDKSGEITPQDAHYILQKAVDIITLPFLDAGLIWQFDPPTQSYAALNANLTDQDFTAILLGDVSGNWSAAVDPLSVVGGPWAPGFANYDLGFRIEKMGAVPTAQSPQFVNPKSEIRNPKLSTPVILAVYRPSSGASANQAKVLFKSANAAICSVDLKLTYDLALSVKTIRAGSQAQTMALANNTNQAGLVRSALAGALPLVGVGELLELNLVDGNLGELRIVEAQINEGMVLATIESSATSFGSDSDGDGQSDLSEIRAGTDPNRLESVFKVIEVSGNPDGSKTVTWMSASGKTYQLETLEEVGDAVWQAIGLPVVASSATTSAVDDAASGAIRRLYRVRLVE